MRVAVMRLFPTVDDLSIYSQMIRMSEDRGARILAP